LSHGTVDGNSRSAKPVVAVDLLEADDERSRRAGVELAKALSA
jgi:hypothetical protein